MTYTTGYRKPPEKSRFKKGISGNPKGRPKGTRNFMTLLDAELAQRVTVNENGKRLTITRMEAIVKRLVSSGLQGDLKSLQVLVGLLRAAGSIDRPGVDELLPANYQQILDKYVNDRRPTKSEKSSTPTGDKT